MNETYVWYFDVPVRNDYDPARIASVLLSDELPAPSEITAEFLQTNYPDGYVSFVHLSYVPAIAPTIYVVLPRGLKPCHVCDHSLKAQSDPECPECGGLGFVANAELEVTRA